MKVKIIIGNRLLEVNEKALSQVAMDQVIAAGLKALLNRGALKISHSLSKEERANAMFAIALNNLAILDAT